MAEANQGQQEVAGKKVKPAQYDKQRIPKRGRRGWSPPCLFKSSFAAWVVISWLLKLFGLKLFGVSGIHPRISSFRLRRQAGNLFIFFNHALVAKVKNGDSGLLDVASLYGIRDEFHEGCASFLSTKRKVVSSVVNLTWMLVALCMPPFVIAIYCVKSAR